MLLSSICAKEASSLGKSPLTLCINCRRVGTKFSQCCFGTSPQAPCRGCSWAVGCWTGWPSPLFTVREPGWEASSHTHAFTQVPSLLPTRGAPLSIREIHSWHSELESWEGTVLPLQEPIWSYLGCSQPHWMSVGHYLIGMWRNGWENFRPI